MPFYDLTCKNGHEQIDRFLKVGERPPCPTCGEPTETLWRTLHHGVIQDSIEGGMWISHGICNEDGTPKKYYSQTDINTALKKKGLERTVRHTGERGSDKSKHTTKWT